MTTLEEILAAGLDHHRAARWQQAETAYRQVLEADPGHPEALHLLGVIALQVGQYEAAVELILRAIAVRGNVSVFHNSLGEAYRSLGRHPQAIECYEQALRLRPDLAEAHSNLGTVYQAIGQLNEAIACFERAIGLRHDYANAHYNRASAWLTSGNFIQGWPEYEWRWRLPEFHRPARPEPMWDGSPLAGRTLLVECEQGLGDTLQFIRFVKAIGDQSGKVLIEVQSSLIPLLHTSGFENLFAQGESLPRFDMRVSMLSFPHVRGTTIETIPAIIPYLAARADRVEHWRQTLAGGVVGLRVGIHWQGNPASPLEPWRSIPLLEFEPLARVEGVRMISLQLGPGATQIAALEKKFAVVDLGPRFDQDEGAFMDTAAVMTSLDVVITSDSAVAHLAGGLGVPVWLALPMGAHWRWLHGRSDCPWYPSMRLFRQTKFGSWKEPFAQMAEQLQRIAGPAIDAAEPE